MQKSLRTEHVDSVFDIYRFVQNVCRIIVVAGSSNDQLLVSVEQAAVAVAKVVDAVVYVLRAQR